jgi:glycosyltransferase involved in cell wall biosynthesis
VSYCFPPYSDTSGVIAAKRVLVANERVDVIAQAMDFRRHTDDTLTRIGGTLVDRYVALNTPYGFASWKSISTYTEVGLRTYQRWTSERGAYAKLYSRAQFAASHILSARIKAASPELPWVAEFSDPLSHDAAGVVRVAPLDDRVQLRAWRDQLARAGYSAPDGNNLFEWCEALTFAFADTIMFTNPIQRDFMLGHCHDPALAARAAERAVVSPHPTLPREFYSMITSDYPLSPDKVNIGYFGRFYPNRGVGLVVDALAGLPEHMRGRVLLHVFTAEPDGVADLVREWDIADSVSVNHYRDYLEFLNLADRMDVLLLNDAVTPFGGTNPFLPSKWSDYKGSSTPVWGILEEGSPLDSVEGIAYRTPVEHVSGIQLTLAQILRHLAPPLVPSKG